jgi:Rrf2 family protein
MAGLVLGRRADYGVRAAIELARAPGTLRSVRQIAAACRIPQGFLGHVLRDLARAGLVTGVEGRSGGYRLARPGDAISLLEVIEAIEGPLGRSGCVLRNAPCGEDGFCDAHGAFVSASDALRGSLATASLSLLARPDVPRAEPATTDTTAFSAVRPIASATPHTRTMGEDPRPSSR